jgi:glyoxylase-like metal-dependent hydrolase (beta-lactamase superfamily II)
MFFKQYYLGCLAHASYLIGDETSRQAVVVDPQRDVDQYLEEASRREMRIRWVFLTHFHADFLAGHLELRDRAGAEIVLGRKAEAEYPFRPAGDRDRFDLGSVRLEILETPGHTPEGISILVYDMQADSSRPQAVLTGDTLFIGDVGRPDLMASSGVSAAELASMLYDSLHTKLLPLPDDTRVYPAHGAGSLCGKNLSTDTVSTIGDQRRFNYALQPMDRVSFIGLVTADLPETPGYFSHDAMLNRRERQTLDQVLERGLKPLTLDAVLRSRDAGATILDVREPAEFAGAHLVGSLNIGLGGKYATWAGTILAPETRIVILAEPGREEEAARRLGRIGYDKVEGYLEGGMDALRGRPDLYRRIDRVTAANLAELLAGNEPPAVLDVRTEREHLEGRIASSINIPLNKLRERIHEVPRARRLVIHCATGYRSSIAASLLEGSGVEGLTDLVGGFAAWQTVAAAPSPSES